MSEAQPAIWIKIWGNQLLHYGPELRLDPGRPCICRMDLSMCMKAHCMLELIHTGNIYIHSAELVLLIEWGS